MAAVPSSAPSLPPEMVTEVEENKNAFLSLTQTGAGKVNWVT